MPSAEIFTQQAIKALKAGIWFEKAVYGLKLSSFYVVNLLCCNSVVL